MLKKILIALTMAVIVGFGTMTTIEMNNYGGTLTSPLDTLTGVDSVIYRLHMYPSQITGDLTITAKGIEIATDWTFGLYYRFTNDPALGWSTWSTWKTSGAITDSVTLNDSLTIKCWNYLDLLIACTTDGGDVGSVKFNMLTNKRF